MSTTQNAQSYALPRDAAESARLNTQHRAFVNNIGYLLHPNVAISLPFNARIADVATGTGVWLTELATASTKTSHQYVGIDISSAQFPAQRADNVTFATLDMLQPIPDGLAATFDLVHVRLLICALTVKDWSTAVRNLLQLLRPGGWLQWEDASHLAILQHVSKPGGSAMRRLLETGISANREQGRMIFDPANLPDVFRQEGFEDVTKDVFASDRLLEVRTDWNQTVRQGVAGSLTAMACAAEDSKAAGMGVEEIKELARQCDEELERGAVYARADLHVVVGRRPL